MINLFKSIYTKKPITRSALLLAALLVNSIYRVHDAQAMNPEAKPDTKLAMATTMLSKVRTSHKMVN